MQGVAPKLSASSDILQGWAENVLEAMDGMPKKDLARQVGVHPSTITRILAGELCPTDELKWKIAGALSQRMDVLWAWPKIVPPAPQLIAA